MLITARRFTLRDMMILVGGLAVALAWRRAFVVSHDLNFRVARSSPQGMSWFYSLWLQQWAPFLVMMTMTGLAVRAIAPRPRWDELRRQPGWVASVATLLSISVTSLELFALSTLRALGWSVPWNPGSFWHILDGRLQEAGLFVALAWTTLILIGHWRPEPAWVDRFGRAVGALWIGYYVIQFSLGYIFL